MAQFKNSEEGYGWVSITFHWLMALAIFGLFGLGLYMVELTYYDTWYRGSLDLHKSAGILLAFAWGGRLVWRMLNKSPQELGGKAWEHKVAHLVHILLYLLMLALFVSGYLISTADGRAIEVFGWFSVPAFTTGIENQEDIAGAVHWYSTTALIVLAGLHALAALKHHFVNKDATLKRIFGIKQETP